MEVELCKIDTLLHDPENSRLHDDRNLEAIRNSLERFGQQKPIVVDKDGKVVAGNGTLTAAAELGWEDIACVRTGLGNQEAVAYAIADNRTSDLAEWDLGQLQTSLERMDPSLLDYTGFDLLDRAQFSMEGPQVEEGSGDQPSQDKPQREAVIQYAIIFDDDGQQKVWFDFLRGLKAKYPSEITIAERIVRFIEESS